MKEKGEYVWTDVPEDNDCEYLHKIIIQENETDDNDMLVNENFYEARIVYLGSLNTPGGGYPNTRNVRVKVGKKVSDPRPEKTVHIIHED